MRARAGGSLASEPYPTPSETALVIFDCDGVLVDSEVISNATLARHLTEAGLATTLTEARREYQGLLLADVLARAERNLGAALPDDFQQRFERERAEAFRRELLPIGGALDAVARIQAAGITICVASQGSLEKTRLSLSITELDRLVPRGAVFSAHDVPRGKPYPDLFLHAAAAFEIDAERCVVVEDTPSGVTAAVAAGMRAFGYAADSDEAALRQAGAEILHSLGELPRVLGVS